MPVEDALEAMSSLAADLPGINLSDEGLAAGMPQALEAPAEPAAQEPQAEPVVAKPAATPVQAKPEPAQLPQIGLDKYLAEREEKQALKRRIEELEGKQKAAEKPPVEIDPFMDPRGFTRGEMQAFINTPEGKQLIQTVVAPMQQQFEGQLLQLHKSFADQVYGKDVVDEAVAEFDKIWDQPDKRTHAELAVMQSQNRIDAAVKWHQQKQFLAEIGTDPKAYRERLLEEALADPEFMARAEAASQAAAGTSQPQEQPRNDAGQFASAPKSPAKPLPSANKAGSGAGSVPLKAPEMGDLELVNAITNAKHGQRPDWAQ